MRGHEGSYGVADNVPKTPIGKVRDINDNTQTLHLAESLDAKGFESASHDLMVAGVGPTKTVLIVPRERDQPYTQLIKALQPLHMTINETTILQGQKS
jgi:hypothetical protein